MDIITLLRGSGLINPQLKLETKMIYTMNSNMKISWKDRQITIWLCELEYISILFEGGMWIRTLFEFYKRSTSSCSYSSSFLCCSSLWTIAEKENDAMLVTVCSSSFLYRTGLWRVTEEECDARLLGKCNIAFNPPSIISSLPDSIFRLWICSSIFHLSNSFCSKYCL